MRSLRVGFPIGLSTAFLSASIFGQPTADVQDWLEAQLQRETPASFEVGIRFSIENLVAPDKAEVDQLRKVVAADEKSGLRGRLAQLEAQLKRNDVSHTTLWLDGDQWRVSRDLNNVVFQAVDHGGSGTALWSLSEDQLTLIDADAVEPGYDFARALDSALADVDLLLTGGLGIMNRNGAEIKSVTEAVSAWKAIVTTIRGEVHLFVSNNKTGDLSITRIDFVNADGEVVFVRHFDGWHLEPDLRRMVATSVTEVNNGAPMRKVVWHGVDNRYNDVAALAVPPAFDGSDPIRGASRFTSLRDNRRQTYSTRLSDGIVTTVPQSGLPERRASSILRLAGWISAIGIIGILILIRVRRAYSLQ